VETLVRHSFPRLTMDKHFQVRTHLKLSYTRFTSTVMTKNELEMRINIGQRLCTQQSAKFTFLKVSLTKGEYVDTFENQLFALCPFCLKVKVLNVGQFLYLTKEALFDHRTLTINWVLSLFSGITLRKHHQYDLMKDDDYARNRALNSSFQKYLSQRVNM